MDGEFYYVVEYGVFAELYSSIMKILFSDNLKEWIYGLFRVDFSDNQVFR